MDEFHTPVLLQEIIEGLNVTAGKKYIDTTLGGGGHALEIVKRGGIVLGIDIDQEAIEYAKSRIQNSAFAPSSGRGEFRIGQEIILTQGNFRNIGEIARRNGFGKVAGILFDLGVSLHQLTTAERGFSFIQDGPLDMRMDPSADGQAVTAADLVNGLYEHELTNLFERFGEEQLARRIAHAICLARAVKRIETTGQLVRIVERVKKRRGKISARRAGRHPATQVFQAFRIAVNDELGGLKKALPQAVELLEPGGKLLVISFHSLEDRIVKTFFKEKGMKSKPIIPTQEEIGRNPKSRSAKLRIYEKN